LRCIRQRLRQFDSSYQRRVEFLRKLILAAAVASMAVPVVPSPAIASESKAYSGKIWRDSKGRYRCKRPNGTTGLIVGAAGGALIGRALDTRGERATGTILGAAAGALLGREIDRNRVRCR
jgi:uncharacterized protein YcfJ